MEKCHCCEEMKKDLQRRRRNTAYADDENNFLTACQECQDRDDEYYEERWAEYYSGLL